MSALSASAQSAPSPTSGTKLTGGLLSPRGMKIGPDGMIYVAEAGTGGTIEGESPDAGVTGLTGRISKVDPATGVRTTVADGLPSNGGGEGDNVGPADVAFIGSQLYYVQTHGGAFYGVPDVPTGLYKVNSDGTTTLVANIGKFNIDNPVDDITTGGQQDIEVGGNPYSMTVRDGKFLVVDGNQNQVMQISTDGTITRLAQFHGHPVTTGIASQSSGPLYVTSLGQFPFSASDGDVWQVGYPSGNVTKIASGFSSMTDVEYGPGGQLYALNFGDAASDPNAPAPWDFGSGKVFKLDAATGTLTPIVTGFSFTTSIIFSGDTAYVANNGVTIPGLNDGEIWKIEGISSIAPLPTQPATTPTAAPAPTQAPVASPTRTGVTAPDTGTGGNADGASALTWLVLAGLGIAGAATTGAAFALKRR
jgi:sugar lactone lactonase YvrE